MADEVINSHVKHKGIKHHSCLIWPHVDLDYAMTYDVDGNVSTIEIVGIGYTKTLTMTYVDGNLTAITTVIT